jgi:hypothetical protein
MEYDKSHGSPWDRGGADSYYRRCPNPHKMIGGGLGERIELKDPDEIAAYWAGYNENEADRNFKDWGIE